MKEQCLPHWPTFRRSKILCYQEREVGLGRIRASLRTKGLLFLFVWMGLYVEC